MKKLGSESLLENELFGDVWASVDHLEALEAFDQKRRPDFRK